MARKSKAATGPEDALGEALAARVLPAQWEDALRQALVQRPQWLLASARVCDIAALAPEDKRPDIARLLLEYAASCTPEQASCGAVKEAVECAVLCAGVVAPEQFASVVRMAPAGPVRNAMLLHARIAVGRADASLLFESVADEEEAQLSLLCSGVAPPQGTALTTLLRLASRMDSWAHLSSIVDAAANTAYIAGDPEAVARLSEHLDVHLRAHHLGLCGPSRHSLADVFRCVVRMAPPQSQGLWGVFAALLLDRDVAQLPQCAVSAVLAALVSHDRGSFVIRVAERHCELLLPCLRALMQRSSASAQPEHPDVLVTQGDGMSSQRPTLASANGGRLGGVFAGWASSKAVGRLLEACACRAVRAGTASERDAAWGVLEALPLDALLAERTVLRLLLDQAVLECTPDEGVRLYALALRAALYAQAQHADGTLWRELQMQWRKQLASANQSVGVLGAAGLAALLDHCAAEIDAPRHFSDMPTSSQAPQPTGVSFPEGQCAALFAEVFEAVVGGTATADLSALVWLAAAVARRCRPNVAPDASVPSTAPLSETVTGAGSVASKELFTIPFAKGIKGAARNTMPMSLARPLGASTAQIRQLPQPILAWLRRKISRTFETRWVRETAKLSSATLASSMLVCALDEPAVCVDLCATPEAVCAVFVLLQALEKAVHGGALDNVDALLGCPVLLPRCEALGGASSQKYMEDSIHIDPESVQRMCEWLCALVNAFSDQDDVDVREKTVRRLHSLHDLLTDPAVFAIGSAHGRQVCTVQGISDSGVSALLAVASAAQTKHETTVFGASRLSDASFTGARGTAVLDPATLTALLPHAQDMCNRLFLLATNLSAWSSLELKLFCTINDAAAANLEVAERCISTLFARQDAAACNLLIGRVFRSVSSRMSDGSRAVDPRRLLRMAAMASRPEEHVDDALVASALESHDADIVGLLCRMGTRVPWDALSSLPDACPPAKRSSLHDATLAGLVGHCASILVRTVALQCAELRALLGVLEAAVQRCRATDCPTAMRVSLLRHSRAVLHSLFVAEPVAGPGLPPAISALQAHLSSSDGSAAIRLLQQCTRGLHIICNHHKNDRPPSRLPALIAPVRRTLEALIFAVRRMLQACGALDAFWLGNLKHRALDGSEVCSQFDAA